MASGSRPRIGLTTLVVAAVIAGCGGGTDTASKPGAPAARSTVDPSVQRALSDPTVARMRRSCQVTQANHSVPPGEQQSPGQNRSLYYGNGRLWTVLWPRGVLVAGADDIERDGSISMKFPWWRQVHGALKITGHRVDARAANTRARIPSGYGPTGFQSSAIMFPTEGCWQVTGSAGNAQLTFVTLVVKARSQ
jgi:hypothetical protein